MNNFNRIAGYYDFLARIVFGRSIRTCQVGFLSLIPDSSDILILGGGTGWIVEELKIRTKNCSIWYIELSDRMISLAKSNDESQHVNFLHGSEKDIPNEKTFDVVITNFFLDLFPEHKLRTTIQAIEKSLEKKAIWLVSDFVDGRWWHCALLWIMYRFFKLTTGIEASTLPRWERSIEACGFKEEKHQFFYGMFIKSSVYRKAHF